MTVCPNLLLLHAGDFTSRGTPAQVLEFSRLLESFPVTHKVVIAGNHELTFDTLHFASIKEHFEFDDSLESAPTKALLTNCVYLEDSGVTLFGYRIWGSPWQPRYCDWAFNAESGELAEKWALIPSDTDILVTHAPPLGIQGRNASGEDCGCPCLLKRVQEINPVVHLFGHIHEGYGVQQTDRTLFINGSNTNRWRKLVNAPIIFDLPRRV